MWVIGGMITIFLHPNKPYLSVSKIADDPPGFCPKKGRQEGGLFSAFRRANG